MGSSRSSVLKRLGKGPYLFPGYGSGRRGCGRVVVTDTRLGARRASADVGLALHDHVLLREEDGELPGMAGGALSRGLSFRGREDLLEVLFAVEPDLGDAVIALVAGGGQVDGVFLESRKPLDECCVLLEPPLVKRFHADALRSLEDADQFVHGAPPRLRSSPPAT